MTTDPLTAPEPPILVFAKYASNAELIVAAHKLGYIPADALVLDATFSGGIFWKKYRPERLVANGLSPGSTPDIAFDFTRPPFAPRTFDVVVYDPPYKYNGTPDPDVDTRYGVEVYTKWQDRRQLCLDGIDGLAPLVARRGHLLVKCMDQVVSGAKRWQTREFADRAEAHGFRLEDMLHMESHRAQPMDDRVQRHAHQNFSTLLVLKRVRAIQSDTTKENDGH